MEKFFFGRPETITEAGSMAHAAAQLQFRAAVANVAPIPYISLALLRFLGVFYGLPFAQSGHWLNGRDVPPSRP